MALMAVELCVAVFVESGPKVEYAEESSTFVEWDRLITSGCGGVGVGGF